MTTGQQAGIVLVVGMMLMSAIAASTKVQSQPSAGGHDAPSVFDGVLSNVAGSPEISTAELRAALTESGAIILDARPYEEYAVSHIPGARAVPAKAGTTPALYVGDATEVAKAIPDQTQPLILYCNGLFCGRSERLADDLIKLGYRNVRRYQLGAPGWRALGGVMQVEKPALLRLLAQDATSVLIDGRAKAGLKPRLHNAVSIPLYEPCLRIVGGASGPGSIGSEPITRPLFESRMTMRRFAHPMKSLPFFWSTAMVRGPTPGATGQV